MSKFSRLKTPTQDFTFGDSKPGNKAYRTSTHSNGMGAPEVPIRGHHSAKFAHGYRGKPHPAAGSGEDCPL